ncbi:MAG: nucleotidyltransferase domain-containing protein [Bdellovibrionales bacterium]|jgi:predicted nucleotidyltransferase|nr:nucleotidyltransferase domain-containing protein [Bdellovibrionales bacterium]
MKFGLSEEEYHWIEKEVFAPLKRAGATLWCYGSRARGDHKKFSDLDIMLESNEDLASLIGTLEETLSQSNFPYKVDIVQERDFAESYKSGYLKDRVLI